METSYNVGSTVIPPDSTSQVPLPTAGPPQTDVQTLPSSQDIASTYAPPSYSGVSSSSGALLFGDGDESAYPFNPARGGSGIFATRRLRADKASHEDVRNPTIGGRFPRTLHYDDSDTDSWPKYNFGGASHQRSFLGARAFLTPDNIRANAEKVLSNIPLV